jgi:hypothetical protein
MHSIPHEIRKIIALKLPIVDYLNFAATCKEYNKEKYWVELYQRDFGSHTIEITEKTYIDQYLSDKYEETLKETYIISNYILENIDPIDSISTEYYIEKIIMRIRRIAKTRYYTILQLCDICRQVDRIFINSKINYGPFYAKLGDIMKKYRKKYTQVIAKFIQRHYIEKVEFSFPNKPNSKYNKMIKCGVCALMISEEITAEQLQSLLNARVFHIFGNSNNDWGFVVKSIFKYSEWHLKGVLWEYLVTQDKNILYEVYYRKNTIEERKHYYDHNLYKYLESNDYKNFINIVLSSPTPKCLEF